MGLFDFFKTAAKPVPQPQPQQTVRLNRPECDISKTQFVAELLAIPRGQRDGQWKANFFQLVRTASFACGRPQLLTGPDGFPYFILRTPEPDQPFESFCIQNMKDDFLLQQGWGIVFNPAEDKTADWVFTHGDIVNFHLNNKFVTATEPEAVEHIAFTKNVGILQQEEKVMIAQPSEDYLPRATRHVLKLFLQNKGISKPKILMLTSFSGGKPIRKLAFNIDPKDYPVATQLDYLMQQVGWFLPGQYIIIPLPKKSSLASGFNEL